MRAVPLSSDLLVHSSLPLRLALIPINEGTTRLEWDDGPRGGESENDDEEETEGPGRRRVESGARAVTREGPYEHASKAFHMRKSKTIVERDEDGTDLLIGG